MTKFWVYILKPTIRQLEHLLIGPEIFYTRMSFSGIFPVNISNSGCLNLSMPPSSFRNPSTLQLLSRSNPSLCFHLPALRLILATFKIALHPRFSYLHHAAKHGHPSAYASVVRANLEWFVDYTISDSMT